MRMSRQRAWERQRETTVGSGQECNHARTRGWDVSQCANTPCTLRLWRVWHSGQMWGGGVFTP